MKRCIVITLLLALVAPYGAGFVPQASAAGASLNLSPSSKTVEVDETFSVVVTVSTGGQYINAAEATLSFSKDILDVQSVSKSGSRFTLWAVEPRYSNGNGTVTFSGGKPSPGYKGSGGTVITVNFKAQKAGTARVTIGAASVLANDGLGTDILTSTGSGTYTVREVSTPPTTNTNTAPPPSSTTPTPSISSTSHPDTNAWYTVADAAASWRGGSGVTGYSVVFDQEAGTVPAQVSDGSGTTFSRAGLDDGVWYLHVRAQYDAGWSGTATHAFRIDRVAPTPFNVNIDHTVTTDRWATVSFASEDATSGIDRYEWKLDDDVFAVTTSPLALADLAPGPHTVTVRAFDKAGNVTEANATFTIEAPEAPSAELILTTSWKTPGQGRMPTIMLGEGFRVRGFAKLGSIVRISVHSETGSVFEFPIETIADPNPVTPAPAGYGAWKVELQPNLAPGEHEIRVTTVDGNGVESVEAPVIKFRVVNNVVRVGSFLIPTQFAFVVLLLTCGVLLFIVALLLLFIRDLKKRFKGTPNMPHPSFWKHLFARLRRNSPNS